MSNNGNSLGRFCIRADINPINEGFRAKADSLIIWCEERTSWLPFTADGKTEDDATVIRSSTGFTTEQHVRTDAGWDKSQTTLAARPLVNAL
jgi:hypothetical protein